MCSLCLSGDDSGEATLEAVEEKFGGVEEVRGFVNAVRAQSEAIMSVSTVCSKVTASETVSLAVRTERYCQTDVCL